MTEKLAPRTASLDALRAERGITTGPLTASERTRRNMRRRRMARGWSLREMADQLAGIGYPLGPNTVWRMEKGDRGISVDDLDAMCRVFGVSMLTMVSP